MSMPIYPATGSSITRLGCRGGLRPQRCEELPRLAKALSGQRPLHLIWLDRYGLYDGTKYGFYTTKKVLVQGISRVFIYSFFFR